MRLQLKILIQRQLNRHRALNFRQNWIQRIARPAIRQLLAVTAKRADAQIQNVIAAISDHDLPGVEAVLRAELLPQRARRRVRIQPQPAVNCRPHRRQHCRRRRVRIFIRVELDQAGHLRLLAGHVAGHLLDIFPSVTHCNLIRADAPCAVSPSTSANACTAGNDFRNAAGVYSIKLVRRMNCSTVKPAKAAPAPPVGNV